MRCLQILLTFAALSVLGLGGCNAVKGLAKDTHDVAQKTEDVLKGKDSE